MTMTTKAQIKTATTVPTTQAPAALRSPLAAVHRVMAPVLSEVPQWRDAARALAAIEAARPAALGQVPNLPAIINTVGEELAASVLATGEMPQDFEALAMETKARLEVSVVTAGAYRVAVDQLTEELDNAVRANEGLLWRALADEMAAVLRDAGSIDRPVELLSAEAVLRTKRTEDHEWWQQITKAYGSVRTRQVTLLRLVAEIDVSAGGSYRMAEGTVMRNVEDVFPEWATWREYGGHLAQTISGRTVVSGEITPPWPETGRPRRLTPTDAATQEFLAWALQVGADLWVPTPSEIHTEVQRLQQVLAGDTENQNRGSVRNAPLTLGGVR